jgi:transcriptional regulator with XRE-family HTH domain
VLGKKVREIRHKKEMTLNELSVLTGLTASYLSQLERDIIEPSLASLRKIGRSLEVPIYTFLEEEQQEHILIRKDKRKKLDLPNSTITYEFLTPMSQDNNTNGNLEVIYYELEPNSWSSDDFIIHSADECIFVIVGVIEIFLGEEKYRLEEGDSIFIKSNIPHRIFNPSLNEMVRGVSSMSPAVY